MSHGEDADQYCEIDDSECRYSRLVELLNEAIEYSQDRYARREYAPYDAFVAKVEKYQKGEL